MVCESLLSVGIFLGKWIIRVKHPHGECCQILISNTVKGCLTVKPKGCVSVGKSEITNPSPKMDFAFLY